MKFTTQHKIIVTFYFWAVYNNCLIVAQYDNLLLGITPYNSTVVLIYPVAIREPENAAYWSYDMKAGYQTLDNIEPNRVVGGHRIQISDAPWQVSIMYDNVFICGGSILTHHWIMTAAHCIIGRNRNYKIRAGTRFIKRGGAVREVILIVKHDGFNFKTMNYDISLMKVRQPFRFGKFCQPLKLPKAFLKRRPGTYLISGWGKESTDATRVPKMLKAALIYHVPVESCREKYYLKFGMIITRYMMCAAAPGKDACIGDSGGALTYDGIAFGIVSFGVDCANPNYPGIYTNVALFVNWIKRIIHEHS